MPEDKRFLVDAGLSDLAFPITVLSRDDPAGQRTVADITVRARVMREFEANWIDRFIQVLHAHRDRIGQSTLRANLADYLAGVGADAVRVDFRYPFFMAKTTPVGGETCLVKYDCTLSAKRPSVEEKPPVFLRIDVPVVTTYPQRQVEGPCTLFGQTSVVTLEVHSAEDLFVEDLAELVERHALSPVYSYLGEADQQYLIAKVHREERTSVAMVDGIRDELSRRRDIAWFAVSCRNYGMLHAYTTTIGTEKSLWIPYSGVGED